MIAELTHSIPKASIAGKKVLIAVSGGVDSSVVAYLLKSQGWDCEAVIMKNWEDDEYCTFQEDLATAINLTRELDINLRVINFSWEYYQTVFQPMVTGYSQGLTPNPDVVCNSTIKFGALLDYAINQGFDYVATGHYAKWCIKNHQLKLMVPADTANDQTYFLHSLTKQQLSKAIWPLGDLLKHEVRQIARSRSLDTADRPTSTGLCFIGKQNFSALIAKHTDSKPGDMIDENGVVMGQHKGIVYYTEGQRKGLNIGGVKGSHQAAWYVVAKDPIANKILVAQPQHKSYKTAQVWAKDVHWIKAPFTSSKNKVNLMVKYRYRQPAVAAECFQLETDNNDNRSSNKIKVVFKYPQPPLASGQSIVFYANDWCLGGGIIDTSEQKAMLFKQALKY